MQVYDSIFKQTMSVKMLRVYHKKEIQLSINKKKEAPVFRGRSFFALYFLFSCLYQLTTGICSIVIYLAKRSL